MTKEKAEKLTESTQVKVAEKEKPVCGIVMPISAIDDCPESHWADVRNILTEAIESVGFEANLVSDADDVGVIHKRIIQNLYSNPIVVVDVSCKNPNVMFELGMRLAFDKPTIIIKDNRTDYSFDTSPVEHLGYPRDLRFGDIVKFKALLAQKIKQTYEKADSDHNYTTFLKHFGTFKVARLDTEEVSGQEYIIDELKRISAAVMRLESRAASASPTYSTFALPKASPTITSANDVIVRLTLDASQLSKEQLSQIQQQLDAITGINSLVISENREIRIGYDDRRGVGEAVNDVLSAFGIIDRLLSRKVYQRLIS